MKTLIDKGLNLSLTSRLPREVLTASRQMETEKRKITEKLRDALDKKLLACVIFIDLQEAFYIVIQEIKLLWNKMLSLLLVQHFPEK